MSGPFLGRGIALTWGGSSIGGVREKKKTLNGAPVDVTSDDDAGWRALISNDSGQNEVNLSLSGVTKTDLLKVDWFGNTRTKAVTMTYPNGGVMSGTFFMASYAETGSYKDAVTYDIELQSSGPVTYVAGT